MTTLCIDLNIAPTLKWFILLVAGTILLTTTYKVDLNVWTLLSPGTGIQTAGFRAIDCRYDEDVANLWNQNITSETVKLFSGLKTGFHSIPFIRNNVPEYSHALPSMATIWNILNEARHFSVCVFINQSRPGLSLVMNDMNFKGAECSKKNPLFSNNSRHQTALASFPRSGNTWTRHLLEYISGIHTGAVYNDKRLKGVFKGEGHTERVIAIKTHFPYKVTQKRAYDSVILLIRRPEDSILSFFNLKRTHTMRGNVKQELYQKEAWQLASQTDLNDWEKFYLSWLKNYKGRIFLLSYKRLTDDFYNEIYRLADFLNLTMTYKTLWCAYEKKEGNFHRNSNVSKGQVYTTEMLNNITKTRKHIHQELLRVFGDAANGVF